MTIGKLIKICVSITVIGYGLLWTFGAFDKASKGISDDIRYGRMNGSQRAAVREDERKAAEAQSGHGSKYFSKKNFSGEPSNVEYGLYFFAIFI